MESTIQSVLSVEEGRLTPPPPTTRLDTSVSSTAGSKVSVAVSAPIPPSMQTRECDYDRDPSPLYKAVELMDWPAVLQICENRPSLASTWVLRKEPDGQLRWRLLPIHAALIFNAPHKVVEALLQSFPGATMCKDDQGMLPLHLALRNLPLQFEIVEELLTAHPAAVYVPDRKGRTPMAGGLVATGGQENNPALSVLELYTQIAAAGEKQRWKTAHDREAQQQLEAAQQEYQAEKEALQEIHQKALRHAQEQQAKEVVEYQAKVQQLEAQTQKLREQKLEMEQVKTQGLLSSSSSKDEPKRERRWRLEAENEALQEMVQLLLAQQASLRQSLEQEERRAVEQEEMRVKTWEELSGQHKQARSNAHKHSSGWVTELITTESSVKSAIEHIRMATDLQAAKSRSPRSDKSTAPVLEEKKEDRTLTEEDLDQADLDTSLQVD
jgi:hypothetical protein